MLPLTEVLKIVSKFIHSKFIRNFRKCFEIFSKYVNFFKILLKILIISIKISTNFINKFIKIVVKFSLNFFELFTN